MSAANDSVILLSRAIDQAGDVLANVHEHQLGERTPCQDWDVGRLVSHLVADPRHFLEMAAGGKPDWANEPDRVLYPAATFRSAGDDLIHHWHEQGEGADPKQVDFQTAEIAVHTWDVARATGQDTAGLDREVAERGLEFLSGALNADNRGEAFGPEQQAPADAGAYERLAAYAGRTV